jgi:hypothetical protein
MKQVNQEDKELDAVLKRIPYPGDDEKEIEQLAANSGVADRVMHELYLREASGAMGISQFSGSFGVWAAAALINILLILLFEGRPMLLVSAVGPAGFYSQLLFVALGAATSVSLIGCVLTLNSAQLTRLLPSLFNQ